MFSDIENADHIPYRSPNSGEILSLLEKAGGALTLKLRADGEIVGDSSELLSFLGFHASNERFHNIHALTHPEDQEKLEALLCKVYEGVDSSSEVLRFFHPHHKSIKTNSCVVIGECNYEATVEPFIYFHIFPQVKTSRLTRYDVNTHKLFNLGSLSAGIAHDLNNIFTGMGSFVCLLKENLKDPTLQTYTKTIENSLTQASDLTKSLLEYAKKDRSTPQAIDPVKCIRDITEVAKRIIDKSIDLDISFPPLPMPIHIKQTDLSQIFLNLFINASDAVEKEGKISVSIQYEEKEEEQYCVLSVSDNGCGIAQNNTNRIFTPFYSTKGKAHGAGLGLAIVKKLVSQANGLITIESTPGEGSTFKVYFPVANSFGKPPVTENSKQKTHHG